MVMEKTRVLILDSAGFNEFGVQTVPTFDQLKTHLLQHHHDGCGFFRVSYFPQAQEEIPAFIELSQAVNYSRPRDSYVNQSWLVLEEADLLPEPDDCQEYDNVIARGRHYGVNILAISLFPAKLPIKLRRMATKICAFATHEPADIKWYRDVFGDQAEELITLPPHYYLEWTLDGVKGPLTLSDARGIIGA